MNSAKLFTLFLRTYESAMASPKNGHTKLLMLNWNPNIDMIHAVAVVPIFAPIITGMACLSVSRPALTKLTVMTVVAVEDCTAAVTNVPVRSPPARCLVMVPRTARRCPPVSFCKPSLIVFMPNMRSARHPIILRIIRVIGPSYYVAPLTGVIVAAFQLVRICAVDLFCFCLPAMIEKCGSHFKGTRVEV